MKSILFLLVVILMGIVLWRASNATTEPFQGGAEGPKPQELPTGEPVIPLVSPRAQTLLKGEVQPFAAPATALLAPPPGQIASVGTKPAEDPANERAPAGRIQSVLESVVGFFTREAPGLSQLGDPAVQLPLSTAKSDKARLEDEMAVLKRNPGLQSGLTQEDVNGIEANLAYLQKKWRQSVNAISGLPAAGPEGFKSGSAGAGRSGGWFNWISDLMPSSYDSFIPDGPQAPLYSSYEGFQNGTGTTGTTAQKSDMTLEDLKDLILKIDVEILRLQASGTTDLNINARIEVLSTIKKTLEDIKAEIDKGTRKEEDIPIRKADVDKFLPAMTNLNTGIPQLISDMKANPVLASLFPKFAAGDISGSEVSKMMFEQYAADFLKNLSYDVTLNYRYKGEAEKQIAADYKQAMADAKFIAEQGTGDAAAGGPAAAGVQSAYRGFFQSVIESTSGADSATIKAGMGGVPTAEEEAAAAAAGSTDGKPSPFNWKDRSVQICGQISARGYSPKDFGCLENPDAMKKEGFSWRGYTRMICNRLQTFYDPSVPELCGCPPPTWPGWNP